MSDPRAEESRPGFDGVFLAIRIALGFLPAAVALGFVGLGAARVIPDSTFDTLFFGTLFIASPLYLLVWSGTFLMRLGAGPVLIVLGMIFGGALMVVANAAIAFGGCAMVR